MSAPFVLARASDMQVLRRWMGRSFASPATKPTDCSRLGRSAYRRSRRGRISTCTPMRTKCFSCSTA